MKRVVPELFHCDVSDGGAGARRMRIRLAQLCDGAAGLQERHDSARSFVMQFFPKLLNVFDLIVLNGKNRRESIFTLTKAGLSWAAAEKRYYRDRNQLNRLIVLRSPAFVDLNT